MHSILKDKTELKLFITFFIIYLSFANWVGWNNESRLALSKSIALEGRLEIDAYANFTGDRSIYNGHYYSDKAPGLSFLAVPEIIIYRMLTNLEESTSHNIFGVPQLSSSEMLLRLILTIILISFPASMLMVLIYRVTSYFVTDYGKRLFTVFSFGLGSLIFPYSTTMIGILPATFLGFLGFYLILRVVRNELTEKVLFLSGILFGFSMVTEYLMLLVVFGVTLYLLLSIPLKRWLLKFLLGIAIGITPLLVYNFLIFSTPFDSTMFHLDPEVFVCAARMLPQCPEPLNLKFLLIDAITFPIGIFNALLSPYKGIVFYSPILVLAFVGFIYMRKGHRNLFLSIVFTLFLFLLFINFYSAWTGGSSFGLRFLVPLMPFLVIPFSISIERVWKINWIKPVVCVLLIISVFNMMLAFTAPWEGLEYLHLPADAERQVEGNDIVTLNWETGSFETTYFSAVFSNPLRDHYLAYLLNNGVRNRVFEYAIIGKIPDIQTIKMMPVREINLASSPIGFILLKIPFLVIPSLTFILLVIWKEYTDCKQLMGISLTKLLFFVILLCFLSRVAIKPAVYDENWYPSEKALETKWMKDIASIYLFSEKTEAKLINLSLESYRSHTYSIYFNGEIVDEYKNRFNILEKLNLESGKNTIQIVAMEDCNIPMIEDSQIPCSSVLECFNLNISPYNVSYDPRCISVGVVNLELLDVNSLIENNHTLLFSTKIFPEEHIDGMPYRWVSGSGSVYFVISSNGFYEIGVDPWTHTNERMAGFYLNGINIKNETIPLSKEHLEFPLVYLSKGVHELNIVSDCGQAESDDRCISLAISNLTVKRGDLLELIDNHPRNEGWFGLETDSNRSFRWMGNDAAIQFYSPNLEQTNLNLRFSTKSYHAPRTLSMSINDYPIESVDVADKEINVTTKIPLIQGRNILRFMSKNGCDVPFEIDGNPDNRCLSFVIIGLNAR